MIPLPSVAPFAPLLADLAVSLRRGNCCLVTADKGWTHLLYHDLHARLRAAGVHCHYIDGKPPPGSSLPTDVGVMLTAMTQLRHVVRGPVEGLVITLPHLDVMAPSEGGWTNISRELVPLLYEAPEAVLLGFRDPTISLLPVVDKLFPRRYAFEESFAECELVTADDVSPTGGPDSAAPKPPGVADITVAS